LGATRSPTDRKRHDQIQPDEKDTIKEAHDKLGWPDAKIGRIFDRDPRTVQIIVSEPKKFEECQAPPDNVNDVILHSWGVPSRCF
jgi:FtsZ-interacting cell division protein YlmF